MISQLTKRLQPEGGVVGPILGSFRKVYTVESALQILDRLARSDQNAQRTDVGSEVRSGVGCRHEDRSREIVEEPSMHRLVLGGMTNCDLDPPRRAVTRAIDVPRAPSRTNQRYQLAEPLARSMNGIRAAPAIAAL